MGKRLTNLSPMGEVIASELATLQVTVVDFCREAHISRVTYYELLKGNATPSRYTADSCAACRRDMKASVATTEPLGS